MEWFLEGVEEEPRAERMWVELQDPDTYRYIGVLINQPVGWR
ncbi:hypothetical protein [Paenibacillus albidus]|nr:hypothetical protein [Paenibacillus albidus]